MSSINHQGDNLLLQLGYMYMYVEITIELVYHIIYLLNKHMNMTLNSLLVHVVCPYNLEGADI